MARSTESSDPNRGYKENGEDKKGESKRSQGAQSAMRRGGDGRRNGGMRNTAVVVVHDNIWSPLSINRRSSMEQYAVCSSNKVACSRRAGWTTISDLPKKNDHDLFLSLISYIPSDSSKIGNWN